MLLISKNRTNVLSSLSMNLNFPFKGENKTNYVVYIIGIYITQEKILHHTLKQKK